MKTITFDETKWKLVPVEPTPDMEGAGRVNMAYGSCTARQVWIAMLAATPAAPSQEPVPFDQWNSSPYTQVLHETIKGLSQKLASMTQSQPVTDEVFGPIVKAAFDAGWAACRDSELVGDNAKEFAWDMSGDEITERLIAALREKGQV